MLKNKLANYSLILASGSPRRQQFFKDLSLQQMEPMITILQERTARMEEVMVEVRSLDHIAALRREIAVLCSVN